jgi:hypothetical protein
VITYQKHGNFYTRFVDGEFDTSIPDDMGNSDRQELQGWLDAGNKLEEEIPAKSPEDQPSYNWFGLAIAFKLSELNQILNQLKDEGKNPQINAIWRISDDLVQVITASKNLPKLGQT